MERVWRFVISYRINRIFCTVTNTSANTDTFAKVIAWFCSLQLGLNSKYLKLLNCLFLLITLITCLKGDKSWCSLVNSNVGIKMTVFIGQY